MYGDSPGKKSELLILPKNVRQLGDVIDVRLLGMAAPFFFSDLLTKTFATDQLELQAFFQICYALILFLIAGTAVFSQRRNSSRNVNVERISFLGSCALGGAYTLLLLAMFVQFPMLPYIAAVIGGIGLAGCYISWLSLFSFRPLKTATASFLISFSLGSILRLVFSHIPALATLVAAVAMVFVFQVLFIKALRSLRTPESTKRGGPSSDHDKQDNESEELPAGVKQVLPLLGMLLLISFILSLIRAQSAGSQYLIAPNDLNLVLRSCFPLPLLFIVARKKRVMGFSALYQVSVFLVISAVFLVNLFSGSNLLLSIVLTAFIRGIVLLFLFLLFVQITQDARYRVAVVFGIGFGIYILAQGIGQCVYLYFNLYLDKHLALNIIYLLVVVWAGSFLYARKGAAKARSKMLRHRQSQTRSDGTAETENLQAMQQCYGLTEREVEILAFIRQGRSKRYIAEALVISENTVRGHVKNLHAKCGVHSKQELIDLLETTT